MSAPEPCSVYAGFRILSTKLHVSPTKKDEKNGVTDFSQLLQRVTNGVTDFFRNKNRLFINLQRHGLS